MKTISIIISTQTKSGTKRQKATVSKDSKGVYINGILIPKQKYVGDITISQLSFVACNEDKAVERAEKFLAKQVRTRVAKANPKNGFKQPKVVAKKGKKVTKVTKSKKKSKTPKVARLPKADYFRLKLLDARRAGNDKQTVYYSDRLKDMKEKLVA